MQTYFLCATFVAALVFFSQSVAAPEEPNSQRSPTPSRALFDAVRWNNTKISLGYKGIVLGGEFQVGPNSPAEIIHDENFNRYFKGKTYVCNYEDTPMLLCRHQPHPSDGLGRLTAFGETVKLRLAILLDSTPSRLEIQRDSRVGRVFAIEIFTEDRADPQAFALSAIELMNQQFGFSPKADSTGKDKLALYSEACSKDLSRIQRKVISALTQQDLNRQKECESEATLNGIRAFAEKKLTTLRWQQTGLERSSSVTLTAQRLENPVASLSMEIDINADGALTRYRTAIAEKERAAAQDRQNKTKKDF